MNADELWRRAWRLANETNGRPIGIERSAEQIYQTMHARPSWNAQEWIAAVETAVHQLIADGHIDLVGPALEMRADWIYQEGI